ncbi:MAG: hypothetical protein GVY32_01795 [Gammaproteobacteria bacterium]|nr:hypothetical protein [Gammaproteobacteria bacterium]
MLRILILAGTLAVPMTATAAVFCVGSTAEFQAALDSAAGNGEPDEIRVKTGSYSLAAQGQPLIYVQQVPEDLVVSGGWSDFQTIQCLLQDGGPLDTSLNTSLEHELFRILVPTASAATGTPNRFEIRNLSFVGGTQSLLNSSAVLVYDLSDSADILIDRVFFGANSGFFGAALSLQGLSTVMIRNSVFHANEAIEDNGSILIGPGGESRGIYFLNNTVVNNQVDTPESGACGGLCIEEPDDGNSDYRALIANNVLWNNAYTDLRVGAAVVSFYFNSVVAEAVIDPEQQAGVIDTDPLLSQQFLDFTPTSTSPLIDAGLREPAPVPDPPFEQDWSLGTLDFYGGLIGRIHADGVDIGAVESPYSNTLFRDRFETP